MKNYFYYTIKDSQYMIIFLKKILGDNKGKSSYYTSNEIMRFIKNLDKKILQTKILKEFVWYYNMYISDDTRHNITLKILRADLNTLT